MRTVTLLAALLVASAWAQPVDEPVPDAPIEAPEGGGPDLGRPAPGTTCMRAIGVAAGVTPGGRDWDFTTPGAAAVTASPVLSQGCLRAGGRPRALAAWVGLDALPWYQHSYRSLGDRAPLWVLMNWGLGMRVAGHTVGAQLVSNAVAVGGGLRWTYSFGSDTAGLAAALDLRLNVLSGTRPDVQGMALVRFHSVAAGDDVASRPAHPIGWPRRSPDWDLRAGFEAGTLIGGRAEIGNDDGFGVGLRAGQVTAWRRDVALQPLGVAFVMLPLLGGHLAVPGGATRYDGDWVPVTGAAFVIGDYDSVARLHLGALLDPAGGGFWSPDLTFALLW